MKRREEEQQNRRRMEEAKRQQMEENRKKMEEANKQRMEEQQKRQAEMRKQQDEQRAALSIRRVIQKLRSVTPETQESLNKELDEIFEKELQSTGTQASKLELEKAEAVEAATQRVAQIQEAQKKEEERRVHLEKERQEAIEKAEVLLKDLEVAVAEAEEFYSKFQSAAAPFAEDRSFSLQEVERLTKDIEERGSSSDDKIRACTEFIIKHGPAMKEPEPVPGQQRNKEPSDLKKNMSALLARVNDCTRGQMATMRKSKEKKNKLLKKLGAEAKLEKMHAAFTKYDKDKDGMLSRKEIVAYAKGEFDFMLSAEHADDVCGALLVDGAKGVTKAQLQLLKVSIGIAREKVNNSALRAKREAREAELVELKEKLLAKIKETEEEAKVSEDAISKAEEVMDPLVSIRPGKTTASEMIEKTVEADSFIKTSKESSGKARELLGALSEGAEDELKSVCSDHSKPITDRLLKVEARVKTLEARIVKTRDEAKRKEVAELDILKETVVKQLRYHKMVKELSLEGLFDAIDANSDKRIEESEFLKFFQTCEKLPVPTKKEDSDEDGEAKKENGDVKKEEVEAKDSVLKFFGQSSDTSSLDDAQLSRVFASFDEEDEGHITKVAFMRIFRHYMKVIQETVMNDTLDIKSGKSLRRLGMSEIVEILEGPVFQESVKISRVKCRAVKDNLEGWVSISGNQGSVYLEDGGNLFKVVKETILTASCDLGDGKVEGGAVKPRKLRDGEILEVREWPEKQEGSGLTRMMCRAKADGRLGWATTVGNTGIVFVDHF